MDHEPTESPDESPATTLVVESAVGGTLARPELLESALHFAKASRARRTVAEYQADMRRFEQWCREEGYPALPCPPPVVALYLSARAQQGRKVSTLSRELSAINQAHVRSGFEGPRTDPSVREVFAGIRKELSVAPQQAEAILVPELRAMVLGLGDSLGEVRDRALLTLGFAGALRRSELVALNVEDLRFTSEGLEVSIRRSKADQEGAGAVVGIPNGGHPATCPVRAVRVWLERAERGEGAVFVAVRKGGALGPRLKGQTVARRVKALAQAAGLQGELFSGHSLRSGLATQAAKLGKSERSIMRHGRWKTRAAVDRYVRAGQVFEDNAAAGLGL